MRKIRCILDELLVNFVIRIVSGIDTRIIVRGDWNPSDVLVIPF